MPRYRPPTQSRSPFSYLAGSECVSLIGLFAIGLISVAINGGFSRQPDAAPQPVVDQTQQQKTDTKAIETDDPEEPAEKREVKALPTGESKTWVNTYKRKDGTVVQGHWRRQR